MGFTYLSFLSPYGHDVNLGPSGVRALPLAAGIKKGGHYFLGIGPSGVRALPLAAGRNVGGHYFRYFSFWSGRSACAALGCWHKPRWPLF